MFPIAQFINRAVLQGTPLLFGSTGEILTEKAGNLNLGIPGIMYIGAISGVVGSFFYKSGVDKVEPFTAVLIAFFSCILGSAFASAIYAFLTVTLKANQNVTGLALTTFGVGVGNFFGGSLIKISGSEIPFLALTEAAKAFKTRLPFASDLGWFGDVFLNYGFMVYLALIIAVVVSLIISKTKVGLKLRAVGENPATAYAAGINVDKYKYFSIITGGSIAGLGGLYYIMDYSSGIWSNNGFGDRGWLAIALVIFAVWNSSTAIIGSYLFGGLYILSNYVKVSMQFMPLLEMLPYVVTIIVLISVSLRRKRETQPPAWLGVNYFKEER